MFQQPIKFPPIPMIGQPESYYGILIRIADAEGNHYAHEAAKVAQYVTLALDDHLDWPAKLRYFQHALNRHCQPPAIPSEQIWLFYKSLADLVRHHAGEEALKLACAEDDNYATRVSMGSKLTVIAQDARQFFTALMGISDKRPEWFSEEDWAQLDLIRKQWMGNR